MDIKIVFPDADAQAQQELEAEFQKIGITRPARDPFTLGSPDMGVLEFIVAAGVVAEVTKIIVAYLSNNKDKEVCVQTTSDGYKTKIRGYSEAEVSHLLNTLTQVNVESSHHKKRIH